MAKKMFLNKERAIPSAQFPSVRREEPDTEIASSSFTNSAVAEKQLPLRFWMRPLNLFQNLMRPGEVC